jgi:predicted transcriptional regulator
MTAKEKLRAAVEALSEEEAGDALRLLEQRDEDPVIAVFRDAPEDDEPWTEDDEAAAAEGRADIAAGRTVSLDQAMREFN